MTKKRAVLLVLALSLAGGWWWMQRPWPIVNAPPPAGMIVAFGDSLTFGTGALPGQTYVDQLSAMIGRPIINSGVAGNTIEQAAGRIDRDVLAHHPAMVIVLLGGNDMLLQLNLDNSFARLEEAVGRIQAGGAMVVLVGLKGLSPVSGVHGRYAKLARRTGSLYVPNILGGIFAHPDLMSDQIHPNTKGYTIMAERVAKAIRIYLPATDEQAVQSKKR